MTGGWGVSKHDSVALLLAKWEDLREQGDEVSAEQLCAEAPELLPELKSQIDQLQAMDWLDSPFDEMDSSREGPAVGVADEPPFGQSGVPTLLGGRYQMESLMAEGGFGQVWRAMDVALLRPVAVKVTTINCYAEARRVAQLKHHGIVTVHDVGNVDGLCYIVFDCVEGMTLAEKIQQKTWSWEQGPRIVAEVALSVQFAHDKGILHRDIKPSNILLDERGRPVLADFGIAVTECELRHEALTSVGTLAYMAPEQLQLGRMLDARTDVYGLGVVFYELLTGRLPYTSPTLSGLRAKILKGELSSPRAVNSAIPEAYAQICLKSLSTNMDDRYSTAMSLADALNQQRMSAALPEGLSQAFA